GYWQPAKKTDAAFHTLTEHWDGTAWSIVDSPTMPSSGSNTLTAVSALSTNNVWAVGYYFDSKNVRKTLIEHWDGTDWSVVSSPDPGGMSDALLGVRAIAANNVWAVGFTSAGYGYDALILHYNGTSWTPFSAAPDPTSAEDVLAGIDSTGPNDVWAVGYHVIGSDYRTLTEHFDGTAWTVQPSANGSDGVVTVVRAVSAQPGDVWTAGFDYRIATGRYTEYTENWNGSSWATVPAALSSTKDKSEMYAIQQVPGAGQVWASARSAHIELICPATPATSGAATAPSAASAPLPARLSSGFATTPGTPLEIPGTVHALKPTAVAPHVSVPTATDVAQSAGIYETTLTHGAVVADFNGDGWPDLFINRHQSPAKLYLNDHDGTFTLVDFGTFPHRDRHGCAAADVNGDGLLDLFCNTGSDRGTEAKRDELWLQTRSGNFTDAAAQYGILQPFDRGRISAFVDANHDGWPDVYAANFPDRADGMPSSNRLFVNTGGTSYRLASEFGLDQELNGTTISVGDYNNDGYDDLLVDGGGSIHLFRNNAGAGFTDVNKAVGLDHRANATAFVDFNRDGKLDVVEVGNTKVQVDIQQAGGTFVPGPSATVQGGFKVAVGDVNGDGWPDIYVEQGKLGTQKNLPDVVFLNDGTGAGFSSTTVTVPSPPVKGIAEDVVPIDFNKDGYTDFLVENGNATSPGSLQLIKFSP
ncbi:MAG TPA: VCBS repeat-containing protein, partial [Actinomycetota bacterium]|nr:VCBS repeat-containing protein [Actinomycetota bacterium]